MAEPESPRGPGTLRGNDGDVRAPTTPPHRGVGLPTERPRLPGPPGPARVHSQTGQPTKRRPLGLLEVEDRLLQAAVLHLLTVIYEADFSDDSYGFRPGRSAHDALAAVEDAVTTR